MKRHIKKACGYLLVGAVVNVAVAWACALWAPISTTRYVGHSDSGARVVQSHVPAASLDRLVPPQSKRFAHKCTSVAGWGVTHHQAEQLIAPDGPEPATQKLFVRIHASGMPWTAVHCYAVDPTPAAGPPAVALEPRWVGGVGMPDRLEADLPSTFWMSAVRRPLPLRPRIAGLAANSLFFAIVLHGLSVYSRWSIGALRQMRGRCPRCAYPFGPADLCPECGHPIRHLKPAKQQSAP